ncbi:hypothetical protein CL630_02265, partial [bacterium]|nr:hypothetical protein [bacterium]
MSLAGRSLMGLERGLLSAKAPHSPPRRPHRQKLPADSYTVKLSHFCQDLFLTLNISYAIFPVAATNKKARKIMERIVKFMLKELFNGQIATLRERGTPEQIVALFTNQRDSVVARMLKIWAKKYPTETLDSLASKGIYLGIPVIPRTHRTTYGLASMVERKMKKHNDYIDPAEFTDMVETPDKPYYIFDVEDGRSTRDKSPDDIRKVFKKQKRFGLTIAETMAFTIHADVLSRHNVWVVGSRIGKDSFWGVPLVYLNDGRPRIHWGFLDISFWGLRSPS